MAEFVQMMKSWKRMCNTMSTCDECPLFDISCWGVQPDQLDDDFEEREKIIEKWNKEHPQPQFPTWEEWLVEQGILQSYYVGGTGKYVYTMSDFGCSPIQDDIAEKLGIQPKEN